MPKVLVTLSQEALDILDGRSGVRGRSALLDRLVRESVPAEGVDEVPLRGGGATVPIDEAPATRADPRIKIPTDYAAVAGPEIRRPVGTVTRTMEKDGRSGAPLAVFRRLARYDGDSAIWVEATAAEWFAWQRETTK